MLLTPRRRHKEHCRYGSGVETSLFVGVPLPPLQRLTMICKNQAYLQRGETRIPLPLVVGAVGGGRGDQQGRWWSWGGRRDPLPVHLGWRLGQEAKCFFLDMGAVPRPLHQSMHTAIF